MILIRTAALAAALLVTGPVAAQAQSQTYRCTAKDGKKYYGSAIPTQCIGRPVEVLNRQGTVVKRIDPEADEKAREEKEAALEKKRQEEAAHREETRRNRALLATYTSAKDIDDARTRALAENQKAIRDVESRMDTIRKRRAGYDKELEFYKGGNKPPAKLLEDIHTSEVDLQAHEDLLAMKKNEVQQINARYDDDKKRFVELTRKR